MGSVVNLNRFRKAKERVEADRRAAENRVAFGRSKAERRKAQASAPPAISKTSGWIDTAGQAGSKRSAAR